VIQEADVPPADLVAVQASVSYLLQLNPKDATLGVSDKAQLFDFTNENQSSSFAVGLSSVDTNVLGIAIEGRTSNINVTIGSVKVPLAVSNTETLYKWFYGNFTLDPGNPHLSVVTSSSTNINQLIIFEPFRESPPSLFLVPHPNTSAYSAASTQNSCVWTYLPESYSSTWIIPANAIHVKAFGFGNGICAVGQLTNANSYQLSYETFILVSFCTISSLLVGYVGLSLKHRKTKRTPNEK
jgi:hypothetical protein